MAEPTSVLVVDDNEDLLSTFSLILKQRGFNVDTAEDGAQAVDKFKLHHFDVTLMDIVMPEMNGVEAFLKIKEMCPDAMVILMTAYSEDELIRTAVDEGAHCVVNKPLRIDQIIALIEGAIASQPILLVDDDADILRTMTRVLEMKGHEVLVAASGEEALRIAAERECEIAFIDVKLPLMDGLETYLRLKQINPGITAVMMTGFRNEVKDALEKAQEASAIDCLFKPFNPKKAVELVNQIKGKPRARSQHERQREHTGS